MKKIYAVLAFAFSTITVGNAQSTLIDDGFENYEVGSYYGSPWLNWDESSDNDLNIYVTDARAATGTKSGLIGPSNTGNGQDVLLTDGNTYSTGRYTVEWKMYVPTDSFGYFNLQETSTPGGSYGYDAYLNTFDAEDTVVGGTSLEHSIVWRYTSSNTSYVYAYATIPLDEWFTLKQVFDLDSGLVHFYVNETEVTYYQPSKLNEWPGSLGSFSAFDLYSLPNENANSAYTGDERNTMYIDDVTLVKENSTVGTNNINNISKNFKFYPNPAHDNLNISGNEKITNVDLFDIAGRLVYSGAPASMQASIKLNGLAPGSYFAKVNVNGQVFTKKVVVK